MKIEGTITLKIDDSEYTHKNAAVINTATSTTFMEESISSAIALGHLYVPRKVMIEVNNYRTATEVYPTGPSGTGVGKFVELTYPAQAYTNYHTQSGLLYDHKIEDLGPADDENSNLTAVASVTNNVLTVVYTGTVGGGLTSDKWWKVDSFTANIQRIDLLDQNNESLTRLDYFNTPTEVQVGYTSKVNFTYDLVITPDVDPITSDYTIDPEWLEKFGEVLVDPTYAVGDALFKAQVVKVYDDSDNPILDLTDPINEPEIAASVEMLQNQSYPASAQLKYIGEATEVRPKVEPKYYIVRSGDTENDLDIHRNEFVWDPPWLAGDSLTITYSV